MADWKKVPLETLLESGVSYGIVQPGVAEASGVPIVRVKDVRSGSIDTSDPLRVSPDIEAKYSRTRLQGGEVLLTLVGSTGQTAVVSDQLAGWNVARAIGVLRPLPEIPPRWLQYFLESEGAQRYIREHLNTTVQATLNLKDVRALPVPLPPLQEREAITTAIGALDDKIAVNERIAATTDELVSALFSALIAGCSAPEEAELGEVALVNSRSVKPESEGALRYIDISSVGVGSYEWPDRIQWSEAPGRARRLASWGSTVWSTVRPNRRSHALVLDTDEDLVFSTGLAVLTPVSVGPAFLYEATRTPEFQAYLEGVAEGSAYPAVRAERFKEAPLLLPGSAAREKFEEAAMALRLRAHQAVAESRTLATLRDALLPQLMSGRLRVKDAEKIVEDHA
ncbi:restriction endonuclease subunit S [Streptomyces longwoodensis]|uniref:restriction endonuclease subunit S n=1 Tax=Streptomyces longwoodensis TaxID=68231 RepID=UPI0033D70C57